MEEIPDKKDEITNFMDTRKEDEIIEVKEEKPKVPSKSILSKKISPEKQKEQVSTSITKSGEVGRVTKLEQEVKGVRSEIKNITSSITKMMFVIVFLTLVLLGAKIHSIDLEMLLNGEYVRFSGTLVEVLIQLIIGLIGLGATYKYTNTYAEKEDGSREIKPSVRAKIKSKYGNVTEFEQTLKE